jgi:hypothetical protein
VTDRIRLVAKILATPLEPKVQHYWGLQEMATAAILFIEVDYDGVILYRFAADGAFAGDTWHQTMEEAQEDANSNLTMLFPIGLRSRPTRKT